MDALDEPLVWYRLVMHVWSRFRTLPLADVSNLETTVPVSYGRALLSTLLHDLV
jgi:hypothetical protein